jgi:hypothetical protein
VRDLREHTRSNTPAKLALFTHPQKNKNKKTAGGADTVSRVAFHVVEPDGSVEEAEVALAPADVVAANILARPLVELAPRIAALTKPGTGQIVLAGLLEEQVRAFFGVRDCICWLDACLQIETQTKQNRPRR